MEHLRTWKHGPYKLELYDTYRTDHLGKCILSYAFYHADYGEEPIFQGADFSCSPMHAIDSDATVGALLGFLSLRPGDTDAEYFEHYTDRQMKFAENEGGELDWIAYLLSIAEEEREEE